MEHVKMKRNRVLIAAAAAAAWVAVIFGLSLHSAYSSHMESLKIESLLSPLAHLLGIRNIKAGALIRLYHYRYVGSDPELILRKLAHFSEYFLLGVPLYFLLRYKNERQHAALLLLAGPAVALADEMVVQKFLSVDRSASLLDVSIDCMGYFAGLLLLSLAAVLTRSAAARLTVRRQAKKKRRFTPQEGKKA